MTVRRRRNEFPIHFGIYFPNARYGKRYAPSAFKLGVEMGDTLERGLIAVALMFLAICAVAIGHYI